MGDYRNARCLDGPERDWRPGQPSTPQQYRDRLIKRFWAKVDKTPGLGPKGECWEWRGSAARGYGQIGLLRDGKCAPRRAHALAWEIIYGHGPVPKGWHVCHKCNNKLCVREEHLFPGTPLQNVHHAQATGLMPVKRPKPAPNVASYTLLPTDRQRQLIRKTRREKRIGFMWLSRALDIHYSHLSRLETGYKVKGMARGLRTDKMLCLLQILGVPEDEFRLNECEIGRRGQVRNKPAKYRADYAATNRRKATPAEGSAHRQDASIRLWLKRIAPCNDLYPASEFKAAIEAARLTAREVATALDVSIRTVYRLIHGHDVRVSNLQAMQRFIEALKQRKAA